MNLDQILIFVKIVETGSFTGAARLMGLPKSTVSRQFSQLEERLGVRLLQRSTRTQRLTPTGQEFFDQVQLVIKQLQDAESHITLIDDVPRGHLRVTVPVEMATCGFAGVLDDFLMQYPNITLELDVSNRLVNLIEEGYDVAIRAGILEDSSLVAVALQKLEARLYASPAYLEKNGTPMHPDQLANHECVVYMAASPASRWRLSKNGETREYVVPFRRSVNSSPVLVEWLRRGRGIGILPAAVAKSLVESNELRLILSEWSAGQGQLYFLYPSRRQTPAKVRVLLDYLTERFRSANSSN